jgi:hypothetical protein
VALGGLVEYGRGVYAAAAFVFLAGLARAGAVSADLVLRSRAFWLRTACWLGRGFGSFCWRRDLREFGLQTADFGEAPADDGVGLVACAVHGGLGAEQFFIEHGVSGGLVAEGGFDFGAAAESPSGPDYFGCEEFLGGGLGVEVIPECAGEDFVLFRFVCLDAVLCGEEAEAEGVLG